MCVLRVCAILHIGVFENFIQQGSNFYTCNERSVLGLLLLTFLGITR